MRRQLAALVTLAAAAGAAGCYSPDVVSGSLRCGSGMSCPAGYSCRPDATCWKDGEMPSATASGRDSAPFAGHWLFTKAATNATTCTDGSHDSRTLENDYVDISKGGKADLTGSYYCDWDLNIAANGASATLVPGVSCMTEAVDDASHKTKVTYQWTASSFTFAKTGAREAVVNAQVSASYTQLLTCKPNTACVPCTTGCTGTCTVTIMGPLTKTD
jgi:hypothetical protein